MGGTDDVSVAAGGGGGAEVDVDVDGAAGGVPQPTKAPSKTNVKIIGKISFFIGSCISLYRFSHH